MEYLQQPPIVESDDLAGDFDEAEVQDAEDAFNVADEGASGQGVGCWVREGSQR